MTRVEYRQKISELEKKHREVKKDLAETYALVNNTVKVGDFVSDGVNTIKVDLISVYLFSLDPQCMYEGKNKYGDSVQILQTSVV